MRVACPSSGMSSGPHGQTSAPAHEFSSANMSNEGLLQILQSAQKYGDSALQRDHCVCFGSHSGSPADPALWNVNCPGNSSQFCGGDSWYTFHLMYLWVAPVEAICSGMPEPVGEQHANVHDSSVSIISTRLFLASARAPADSILRAMNLSVIFS